MWTLPVITFVVHLAVQWWAFWYPGAEPGGGGYIAQRIFSARDERHGLLSVLWFNLAHYALRPWPWVLTALAAVVSVPGTRSARTRVHARCHAAYTARAARNFAGRLYGCVHVHGGDATELGQLVSCGGFLPALREEGRQRIALRQRITAGDDFSRGRGRVGVHATAVGERGLEKLSWNLERAPAACICCAGNWWRVNAWSEISAMAAALATTLALHSHTLWMSIAGRPVPFPGSDPVVFAKTTLCTTGVTTLVWLGVTLLTPAEPEKTLVGFYNRVRPDVRGWKPVARASGIEEATRDLGTNLLSWLTGCVFVYSALFSIGQLCFGRMGPGLFLVLVCAASGVALYRLMPKPAEWRAS